MSLDDFVRLTPDEFEAVAAKISEREDERRRDGWEQARIVAKIAVSPYLEQDMSLEQFMPLPWDEKKKVKILSKEEDRKRMEEIVKRVRGEG